MGVRGGVLSILLILLRLVPVGIADTKGPLCGRITSNSSQMKCGTGYINHILAYYDTSKIQELRFTCSSGESVTAGANFSGASTWGFVGGQGFLPGNLPMICSSTGVVQFGNVGGTPQSGSTSITGSSYPATSITLIGANWYVDSTQGFLTGLELTFTDPPTHSPTTNYPTNSPTPTASPTASPTNSPTTSPITLSPIANSPTTSPTSSTASPTFSPTKSPTTVSPTTAPVTGTVSTSSPTSAPSRAPTLSPTLAPTQSTTDPTTLPTLVPTFSSISPTSSSPTPPNAPTMLPFKSSPESGMAPGSIAGIVIGVIAAILLVLAVLFFPRKCTKMTDLALKIKGDTRELPEDPREIALEGTIKLCEQVLKGQQLSGPQRLFVQSIILSAKDDKRALNQLGIHSGVELANLMTSGVQGQAMKVFDMDDFEYSKFLSQGEGGSADLYKEKATGTEVVIKVPHQVQELEAEAKVWCSVGLHPNVARMIGIAHLNKIPRGIIMEYYPGGSLDSQVQEFSAKELLRIAVDLARGLQFLHAHKVIHRDLAARNILIARDRRAAITDFGLSRKLDENDTYEMSNETKLPWRTLAPELLLTEDGHKRIFTEKTDIWALGVTLWELGTNSNAYAGRTEKDPLKVVKQKIGNGAIKLDLTPIIMNHQHLAPALVGCFNRDPARRPTAEQLRWLLKDDNSAEVLDRRNYIATVSGEEYA